MHSSYARTSCVLLLAMVILLAALGGSALAHGTTGAAKNRANGGVWSNGHGIGPARAVSRPKRKYKKKAPVAPAPAPAPVQPLRTSNCFPSPHSCGYPDPTNTGVPAGVPLTASGPVTITQPGAVVSGLQVTGSITIAASNVTIENTRVIQTSSCGLITACGNSAIEVRSGLTGVVIRNVETASAPGATCEHDIRNTGSSVTIERAYLHACDSNIYAVGPTTLKDSYGIAQIAISTDHIENVYFNETSFAAIHDTLLNPVSQTAVIFGNSGGGEDVTNCTNQLTVLGSLLAGGGYTIYPCAHAAQAGTSSFRAEGNHFARCATAEGYEPDGGAHPCVGGPDLFGYFFKSGSYGVAFNYFTPVSTWRGNVWDNNLARVCINGSAGGCE